ncbi:hypothetical protein pipiens_008774 [Culex pipiens pipiens]|uniref:F-box domain-containing protein n=1 Tax=Culex pipiens pipiens TaxID=38569 RepID=A0ABD1DJV1_CULPP
MDVDQEKESDAGVADELSINDMPNEILLMIFRSLTFRQLVTASAVNHRWNELAFFLFQNRVSLQLGSWAFEGQREWTRTYTALSLRASLPKGLDTFAVQPLADGAQTLDINIDNANDGTLLEFLRLFRGVETLLVNIDRIRLSKTKRAFLRKTPGFLPAVRHLTLRCRYVRMVGLLAEVAPRLFDCLQSLTLRFKLACVVASWEIPEKQNLVERLRQLTSLRKLGLFADSDINAFEVAFALPFIEELTLGGRFKGCRLADFRNLTQMTSLRSLSLAFEAERFSMYGVYTNPLPTVEVFRTNESTEFPLPAIIGKFPNLKVLSISTATLSDLAVQAMVGSTWQNTMEDLSIVIASIKPSVVASFVALQKLKKLSVFCCDDAQDGLSAFNAIAEKETMKELHIQRLYGMQWWPSAAELGACNPGCAVYINKEPAKFYGRTPL